MPQYTLLLKNGHTIDPANKIDAPMDVAIADGKIAAVAPDIASAEAAQTIDASGLIITPGLIDMPQNEAHVGAGAIGDAHALADGIVHQRVKPMVHREVAVEIDSPEQSQQAPGAEVGTQQIADAVGLHRVIVQFRTGEVGEREVDPHICGQRCGPQCRSHVGIGEATLIRQRRDQVDRGIGAGEQRRPQYRLPDHFVAVGISGDQDGLARLQRHVVAHQHVRRAGHRGGHGVAPSRTRSR